MTDITEHIAVIRAALDAGPPPGPWSWWTSCSYRRLSSDATSKDGDVLYAAVNADGVGDVVGSEATQDYIAACHPERMRLLLDALESATRDAERYRWLRAECEFVESDNVRWKLVRDHGQEWLDAAIDAAMKGTP